MGKGKNGYGSKAPIMVLILQDVLAIAIADVAALFLRFELDYNHCPLLGDSNMVFSNS